MFNLLYFFVFGYPVVDEVLSEVLEIEFLLYCKNLFWMFIEPARLSFF